MIRLRTGVIAVILLLVSEPAVFAQTLRGSTRTMERQNRIAQQHDYTFLRTGAHVDRFVELGLIVPLTGTANYEVVDVSHPFARPEVKLFVERLSAQYRAACGEKLVVTSLTRPLSRQPSNASDLSVHPTGMAVDIRVSNRTACRRWLEQTLLSLERSGVLDAIRERRPPHYHVAVFPQQYAAYVDRLVRNQNQAAVRPTYQVTTGDTLWSIAERFATTVDILRNLNGIRGSRILAGQLLAIPLAGNAE